jgi:SNF2 family DNA or RNA helicase
MKVFQDQPFQIIYSLYAHEYLGYLFEAFVIQLNAQGELTLQHQSISPKNAIEFVEGLDEVDFEIITLIDDLQQDHIVKNFCTKKLTPTDFFLKNYDPDKGDKQLQETISTYVQSRMGRILALLEGKQLFIMGKDGEPTWRHIQLGSEKATVLFHFMRNENNTHYFPTIKYQGAKLDFQYKDAVLVCNYPAYLLLEDTLYSFEKDVDGKKLQPFLSKKFIEIPRKVEEMYFKKFVAPLVESFDVHAKGFDIKSERYEPTPFLTFSELPAQESQLAMFSNGSSHGVRSDARHREDESQGKILFDLSFRYGGYQVMEAPAKRVSVSVEKTTDSYIFHRLIRNIDNEKGFVQALSDRQLEVRNGKAIMEKATAFNWLNNHAVELEELGFKIKQGNSQDKNFFIGETSLKLELSENHDWFDVHGTVRFGAFEIPFIKLKPYILNKRNEYKLPNGQIAIIPEEWFTQYIELFAFTEGNESLTLQKHHLALVKDLEQGNLATVTISRRLEKLRTFEEIEDKPLPELFKGTLRNYQKAGYNWLHFLNEFKFGGCLADDMGLGKTVQTLALLQYRKELGLGQASLLVMPTSLIYNWQAEAAKFTPNLRILAYTGTYRDKRVSRFQHYDLILTSYGIVRLDAELLKKYYFDYIILDESQAIKNPGSNTSQSVRQLKSKNKLILTGTPVENSTLDLWSQMSFVNPGLLGTETFFRKEFLKPIEKDKNEDKTKKLHSLIKPFILRRQKSQVATELPEKVEQIRYCRMTEEQEHEYEQTKSYYRNKILKQLDEGHDPYSGASTNAGPGANFLLLQGLMKLRQIANHPRMADPSYLHDSGKLKEIVRLTRSATKEGHKILIFSQFVRHLELVRQQLDERGIVYTYLDGSSTDRQEQVNRFQTDEQVQVFLISLKAGGVGLNLTAADYVFILDPWWNPAVEAQAIDRAHRIGQVNTVFIYKFISKSTVEEKILALQEKKLQLVHDLISVDESVVKNLTREDIEELLS